uniref:Uncharacterized protein n=1 Tax=Salix viminalis TaxID=40686 RepID=A0A6N2LH27_SALVM
MKTTQLINFFNQHKTISHMSRVSPIPPDLREASIQTHHNHHSILDQHLKPDRLNSKSQDDVDPDDLFARFAAIKAPNNTTSNSIVSCHEDEIEKIIRWARDSARLDNSPLSDL